jgi:hypothetical protein
MLNSKLTAETTGPRIQVSGTAGHNYEFSMLNFELTIRARIKVKGERDYFAQF